MTDNPNGWISVKDKLPDTDDYYLVTEKHSYGDSSVSIVHFTKDLKAIDEFDFYGKSDEGWYVYDGEYGYVEVDNVVAWQPLPEPYKEGGAE